MIYSRWRPDKGGWDYFRNGERRGLGDDLPIPRPRSSSPIGSASVSIGRSPQGSLRWVGSGEMAQGMVLPASKAGLSGVPWFDHVGTAALVALGFVGGVLFAHSQGKSS